MTEKQKQIVMLYACVINNYDKYRSAAIGSLQKVSKKPSNWAKKTISLGACHQTLSMENVNRISEALKANTLLASAEIQLTHNYTLVQATKKQKHYYTGVIEGIDPEDKTVIKVDYQIINNAVRNVNFFDSQSTEPFASLENINKYKIKPTNQSK